MTKKKNTPPPKPLPRCRDIDINAILLPRIRKPTNDMAFTPDEENYISQRSRQERVKLHNMLTTHASRDASVPRRVRLLKSGLDTDLKISLFARLANDMDPKFTNWVEQALKLPIGRYTPMPPRKDGIGDATHSLVGSWTQKSRVTRPPSTKSCEYFQTL